MLASGRDGPSARRASVTARSGCRTSRARPPPSRSRDSTSRPAATRSGSVSIGTNALLRNVSGNTTMKPTPMTASGERTIMPDPRTDPDHRRREHEQQQDRAGELPHRVCSRQPTSRSGAEQHRDREHHPSELARGSGRDRYADAGGRERSEPVDHSFGEIGRDRSAGPINPNVSDWMRIPPIRYSR